MPKTALKRPIFGDELVTSFRRRTSPTRILCERVFGTGPGDTIDAAYGLTSHLESKRNSSVPEEKPATRLTGMATKGHRLNQKHDKAGCQSGPLELAPSQILGLTRGVPLSGWLRLLWGWQSTGQNREKQSSSTPCCVSSFSVWVSFKKIGPSVRKRPEPLSA